ncbi:MAG: DUF2304 domain-containing protein [Deltaproteobacteria bacterium]|nr:DUF2304 domain-containing protein [Deltaproteobacteria bacterium]
MRFFSYHLTSFMLGIIIAGVIIILVRKDLLHTKYSFWWLLVALGSIVFGAFPRLIDWIGAVFGVHYPPVLFIIVGIGLILIKMLTMDIDHSEQERRLRILTQRLALYEEEGLKSPAKMDEPEIKGGKKV